MQPRQKIILDLCGGSGSWGKPWKDAGYDVWNITLPNFDVRKFKIEDGYLFFGHPDKREGWIGMRIEQIYGVLAAPPCTEFSIAKNYKIERKFGVGMEVVSACLNVIWAIQERSSLHFWAIENPVGLLKKFLGKETFSFQPWEFGDSWSKKTLLWGLFKEPKKKFKKWEDVPKIEGLYYRPGRKTASIAFQHLSHKKFIRSLDLFEAKSDAEFRAITSPAFAKAFFEANHEI